MRAHEATLLADNHLAAAADNQTSSSLHQEAIVPKLDPKSDKYFFHTDYPDDHHPSPSHDHLKKFDHPYPVVQDHQTYDKDFVKDENSDNGEWQAQMEYDVLRNQLRGKQGKVDDAHKKEQEEQDRLNGLTDEEKAAEAAAKKAHKDAEEAREDAEKAHDEEERLGGKIGDAVDKVKDRMKHLRDCQKELAEAKAKLQSLMKEKQERLKKNEEARESADKANAEEKAKVDSHNAKEDADLKAAMDKGEAKIEKAEAESKEATDKLMTEEEKIMQEIAEAEAAHAAALRAYKKEQEQQAELEGRLKEAAAKLRKVREGVDEEGGIYKTRSGSSSVFRAPALGIAMAASVLASARVL